MTFAPKTFVPKTCAPKTCAPRTSPLEYDDALRKFETRKLTRDGWFWPVRRADMRHGPTIRARMLEDLQIISLTDYPDEKALAAKGWSLFQIVDHAPRALDSFFHALP